MPGPLYNQQTVSLGSLLVPYPQYSGSGGVRPLLRRRALQLARTESTEGFSKGYNFLFSYVYIREKSQIYFNDLDTSRTT